MMKAITWQGSKDVKVQTVADPACLNPQDAVIRVTLAAICGSDLHLYNGWNPTMKKGDILGHEFMGEVVDVGSSVKNLKVGDKVVVPFDIACGNCFFCKQDMHSLCNNSNPNAAQMEKAYDYPTAGLYGYSHMYGGYAGGQAEFVRVVYADYNACKVPEGVSDEKALFTGDILSTAYMAAENCQIKPGDTVAVWGCGPVGQFAILSAYLQGAERVIAIDRFPDRLKLAREKGKAEVINYEKTNIIEELKEATGGLGPDACIDAVGMEAHGKGLGGAYDHVKQVLRIETDRPNALRDAIQACRPGGTVSIPGVYSGFIDKFPMGLAFGKGLTLKMGQTHTQRYARRLLAMIAEGQLDPTYIITHRVNLDEVPESYKVFNDKEEACIKVVLKP